MVTFQMNAESQSLKRNHLRMLITNINFEILKQKEKAFIAKEDWAVEDDSDDECEYVNLVFMTNSTDQDDYKHC